MIRKLLKNLTNSKRIKENLNRYNISLKYFSPNRKMVTRGVFVGIFISLIPMPFQIFTTILLSPILRFNILVALFFCLLSNPLTMPPLYYIEYLTGSYILGIEPDSVKLSLDWFSNNLSTIAIPLYVGTFFYSFTLSILGYFLSDYLWRISLKKQRRENG